MQILEVLDRMFGPGYDPACLNLGNKDDLNFQDEHRKTSHTNALVVQSVGKFKPKPPHTLLFDLLGNAVLRFLSWPSLAPVRQHRWQ